MTEYQIVNADPERAFLVGAGVKGDQALLSVDDSLDELELLADTAGMDIVGRASQQLDKIEPATFIGSGKVEEIREQVDSLNAQVVIFDDELSPRHQRELEKRFGEKVKLLDRSALILDIFAQHAHTREGALQVELAQYEYRLPRLTRQWTHLARQAGGGAARGGSGGVGLRGPGETQLEVDRREIGRKITRLKHELDQVRAHRSRHRAQRMRSMIPVVSLVGYTNAGKSTLFRAITGSEVYIADQLFATLDPTTRRIGLPSGRQVLLTDTVGFIQKLPTTLIAAFRATLEEVVEADVILHVVDSSHLNVHQHIEAVEDTLAEIGMPSVPRVLVWNKIDLIESVPSYTGEGQYTEEVHVSALRHIGLDGLLEAIEAAAAATSYLMTLRLPYQRGDLISYLHETATIDSVEHTPDGVVIVAHLTPELYDRYKVFQV
jgi:GTPase